MAFGKRHLATRAVVAFAPHPPHRDSGSTSVFCSQRQLKNTRRCRWKCMRHVRLDRVTRFVTLMTRWSHFSTSLSTGTFSAAVLVADPSGMVDVIWHRRPTVTTPPRKRMRGATSDCGLCRGSRNHNEASFPSTAPRYRGLCLECHSRGFHTRPPVATERCGCTLLDWPCTDMASPRLCTWGV